MAVNSTSGDDLGQLAQAAAEDVVRRRYNAVMGIEQATEGWREPIQFGIRNMSSALAFLRLQMTTQRPPKEPILDCIQILDPNDHVADEVEIEPRSLGLPLPPLKLVKQRQLLDKKPTRCSTSTSPGKKSSVFPRWLWKRPDFQEIYRTPSEDYCMDMLMKPLEKRSHFEILTSLQWIRSVHCFPQLSDDSRTALLKVSKLATIRKGLLLYTRNEVVDSLFLIRSGVFEMTHIDDKPGGYSEQVSVGFPIGFPMDLEAAAEAKRLKRRSPCHLRWDMLRALIRPITKTQPESFIRKDSARALSDSVVICIPYDEYVARLADEDRQLRDRAVQMLMKITIFSTWSMDRLYRLASKLITVKGVQKQLIIDQGSSLDYVYFVESGSISLTRQVDLVRQNRLPVEKDHWVRLDTTITKSFVVDIVNAGDYFGEDAVLGMRRNQAREFAFFKVYSSLGNCSSIKNLHTLNVLDDDEVAFCQPATNQSTNDDVILTERGRLLKCPPLTRKVTIKKSVENRPRHSRSNVELRTEQHCHKPKKKMTKSQSEALLTRLLRPNDASFETGALIAIRAHLEALLSNHRSNHNKARR